MSLLTRSSQSSRGGGAGTHVMLKISEGASRRIQNTIGCRERPKQGSLEEVAAKEL